MRNFSLLLLALAVCFSTVACTPERLSEIVDKIPADGETGNDGADGKEESEDKDENDDNNQPEESTMVIKITVGGKEFSADIEPSETGRAFIAKLPLTLDMSELNGNEKYCYGVSLPRADKYFGSIAAGDLMLYSGNCIVLFYGPAGGYSYTRIGQLQSVEGLSAALGSGSVKVTFSKE